MLREQVIPHFQILCFLLKGLSCSLAVGSKSNIVAKGKVYVELGPETKLHNVPLGPNNARQTVDKILEGKDHVVLPIPVHEMVILKDALGSQVAWPKHLVLKGIETKKANSPIPPKNSKKENAEVTSRAPVRNHTWDLGKGRSCSLAVDFKSNVVAKGIVYEELGPETKLHNVPLGQYNSHVAVGKILEGKEQALLPYPVGDKLKFVEDAIGSHAVWPRELVVKANQPKTEKTTLEDQGPYRIRTHSFPFTTYALHTQAGEHAISSKLGRLPSATCVELLGSSPLRSRTIAAFSTVVRYPLIVSYLGTRYSSNRTYQGKGPAQPGCVS
ncbi:hypothetical protein IFM89_024563 [Coptis chinensis]|uniref:DUF8039 domain-containing protein n=1 Tax=Coptis chinensis TaxID=261450 RepID=A0A835ISS2_9MAGN|nr:hypothetical protein IFM89_024563 [Coptis chinensis]